MLFINNRNRCWSRYPVFPGIFSPGLARTGRKSMNGIDFVYPAVEKALPFRVSGAKNRNKMAVPRLARSCLAGLFLLGGTRVCDDPGLWKEGFA